MKKLFILSSLFIGSISLKAQSGNDYWKPVSESKIAITGKREIVPNKYKTFHLDLNAIKSALALSPSDKQVLIQNSAVIVSLPMPDGSVQRFKVVEAPVMDAQLQAGFPHIRTYSVHGIDDAYANGKLDVNEFGFHGMIFNLEGTVFIDPYCKWNTEDYISYFAHDFEKPLADRLPEVGVLTDNHSENATERVSAPNAVCAGQNLRTYRLAVACTKEYAAAAVGISNPSVSQTLAKVVTSVNRVDGVYEKEVAVRLVLVSTTTLVLYTSATGSYFTTADNSNAGTLIGKSHSVITASVGTANFDIGHTFSTGGGGLAQLGCVCNSSSKGQGITGSPSPVGDPYDIDYVAHEVGHQFRGNHTFRANTGSCSGNGNLTTSMEPGSGVTIMGYAGICGTADNILNNSIPYFHAVSYDEIMAFTTNNSTGGSCDVLTSSGNNPPVVSVGALSYNVPANTPFALTGSATDPDAGDVLTYQWEEMDAGSSFGAWNVGTKPFFRSYAPAATGTRNFPILSAILSGSMQSTKGEYLPTNAQTLKFRLNVRDNKMGGGGVCSATTQVNVNASGPFAVTSQSVTGITYPSGSTQTVTWDVANTTAAPINCANVNIYISNNAGTTFTLVLANTPNDGTENIVLPNLTSTSTLCRVKVESVGNIFFDINSRNFTISAMVTGLHQYAANGLNVQMYPNPFTSTVKIDINAAHSLDADKTVLNVYDILGNLVRTESIKLTENFTKTYDLSSLANGSYIVVVTDGKQKSVTRLIKM